MGNLEVSPDRLLACSDTISGLHDQVSGILTTLHGNLSSRGTPWGNDSNGHSFAYGPGGDNGYLSQATAVESGSSSVAGALGSTATGQAGAARGLECTDDGSSKQF